MSKKVSSTSADEDYQFVRTTLPLLYDPALPDFTPPPDGDYRGGLVRIKVKVDPTSPDHRLVLERARADAVAAYRNAQVVIIPEFDGDGRVQAEGELGDDDDETLVRRYVEEAIPSDLKERIRDAVALILSLLEQVAPARQRRVAEINFDQVQATNVLSFKDSLTLKFRPGVSVVIGVNHDWNRASNGAGKSNLLQLVRVALFGSTTKGEGCDDLVNVASKKSVASVTLQYRDGQGRKCEVVRSRNPVKLNFRIDGVEQSSGNTNGRTGLSTQELIERNTGLTEQTFDHSLFIDQKLLHRAHGFLYGTDKDRKELLEQFADVAKYGEAMQLASKQSNALNAALETKMAQVERYQDIRKERRASIARLRESQAQSSGQQMLDELEVMLASMVIPPAPDTDERQTIENKYERCKKLAHDAERRMWTGKSKATEIAQQMNRTKAGTCSKCGQQVSAATVAYRQKELQFELDKVRHEMQDDEKIIAIQNEQMAAFRDALIRWTSALDAHKEAKQRQRHWQERQAMLREQLKASSAGKEIEQLRWLNKQDRFFQEALELSVAEMKQDVALLTFCVGALSRTGIVNYIYDQLCQPLNRAAQTYSELFTGGVIRLYFRTRTLKKSGEFTEKFDVQVVNTQGGELARSQSRGEEQLAAFMCVLCLREIGVRSNLLLLDEPTEGLDAVNAQRFADGLEALAEGGKSSTILLATHNDVLKNAFEGEITVEKKGRVSRLT